MSAFGLEPGQPLRCISHAIELKKELVENGVYRAGFTIGGGIDQDPSLSRHGYPDKGVYVTTVDVESPAEKAGLLQHDKILQVNGHDFTMLTHEKAVKYIKKYAVLKLLVARN